MPAIRGGGATGAMCDECRTLLMTRGFLGGIDHEWFMVHARVWRAATKCAKVRFLCVGCMEDRLGRKLVAADFRRSAKVNFTPKTSARLRRRMKGLTPANRLIDTTFTLWRRRR